MTGLSIFLLEVSRPPYLHLPHFVAPPHFYLNPRVASSIYVPELIFPPYKTTLHVFTFPPLLNSTP